MGHGLVDYWSELTPLGAALLIILYAVFALAARNKQLTDTLANITNHQTSLVGRIEQALGRLEGALARLSTLIEERIPPR